MVGRVVSVHGRDGAVIVISESDNPDRFAPKARLGTDNSEFPRLVVVDRSPLSAGRAMTVRFAGITDRAKATQLVGSSLVIDAGDRRRLDGDEYWPDQLIGLNVIIDGAERGSVVDVIFGPQTRLDVELDGEARYEIPFVSALVPEVRLDEGYVVIEPIEGLVSRH